MSDVVITAQMRVPDGSTISAKPSYLITLKKNTAGKTAQPQFFIALDKPDTTRPHFVPTKGFFSSESEEDIVVGYRQMIAFLEKEKIIEIEFEATSIFSIRSLVYRAK